jgi:hypothetical protein
LDWGHTWRTADGTPVALPVTSPANPALALELESLGELNYLRDMKFDPQGRPVVVFVSSHGWMPGEQSGPHLWNIARWDGTRWTRHRAMPCGNNYDHGELSIDPDGAWRIIAPTERGPQPGNPGGEVALWISHDNGATWHLQKRITSHSLRNHTFCRRPLHADPAFAAFWADGNPRQPSECRLYFCDRDGEHFQKIQA